MIVARPLTTAGVCSTSALKVWAISGRAPKLSSNLIPDATNSLLNVSLPTSNTAVSWSFATNNLISRPSADFKGN